MQLPNTTQLFLQAPEDLVSAPPTWPHFNPASKLQPRSPPAPAAAAVGLWEGWVAERTGQRFLEVDATR